jgi:hypothetical protein
VLSRSIAGTRSGARLGDGNGCHPVWRLARRMAWRLVGRCPLLAFPSLSFGHETVAVGRSWSCCRLSVMEPSLSVGRVVTVRNNYDTNFSSAYVDAKSTAAGHERGRILRALIKKLERHISFAEQQCVPMEQNFPELLTHLVSTRPSACAEAMDAYSNLRSLALRVLHADFSWHAKVKIANDKRSSAAVVMRVYKSTLHYGELELPLSLLQSVLVVLSIWKDQHAEGSHETAILVQELADAVLHPENDDKYVDGGGLASAELLECGTAAVFVEYVS